MWNEQSNWTKFRIIGTTTTTTLPDTFVQCNLQNKNFSLISMHQETGSKGTTIVRCKNSSDNKGTQFEIKLRSFEFSNPPTYCNFETGIIDPQEWDLVQTLSHEFTHTMNMDHTDNGSIARPTFPGETRQRDPYYYDLHCMQEANPQKRNTIGYFASYTSNNISLSPNSFTIGTKGTPGYTNINGSQQWTYISSNNSGSFWKTDLSLFPVKYFDTDPVESLGYLNFRFREQTPQIDRIMYSSKLDTPTLYDFNSHHTVSIKYSNDGFNTISGPYNMHHCSSMLSWFTCANISKIQTSHMPSIAWNDDFTVTAWTHLNRYNDGIGNNTKGIRISAGLINSTGSPNGTTISQPDWLPDSSAIRPAIACSKNNPTGYDCMVAFVPEDNEDGIIYTRRFSFTTTPYRYQINYENQKRILFNGLKTTSSIAMWYGNNKFWVAVKPYRIEFQDKIEVYYTENGITWTMYGRMNRSSLVGPSAISHWRSDNVILLWE